MRGLQGASSPEPEAIIAAAAFQNPDLALREYQRSIHISPKEEADWQLEELQRIYGRAPDLNRLLNHGETEIPSWIAVQQAAFQWELEHGLQPGEMPPPFWYEPAEPIALLLLPIESGADALAYIHWWGSSTIGTPSVIALLRSWQHMFGAEIMCHYGTVLQLHVGLPLTSPLDAFSVASQLETICMNNSIRESAWRLLGASHWHLHNRP